jgi:hypothetical protein
MIRVCPQATFFKVYFWTFHLSLIRRPAGSSTGRRFIFSPFLDFSSGALNVGPEASPQAARAPCQNLEN